MSLRERLAGRARPTATYRLRIDDTTDAERELSEAQTSLLLASTEEEKGRARQDINTAQAALDACFEPIVMTAMPPREFEDLVDEHPARKDTDDEAWNTETFPRACFLACAPNEMSAEEWDAFLAERCSDGEQIALFTTAIDANLRLPDPSVPKGLMEMLA